MWKGRYVIFGKGKIFRKETMGDQIQEIQKKYMVVERS